MLFAQHEPLRMESRPLRVDEIMLQVTTGYRAQIIIIKLFEKGSFLYKYTMAA